MKRLSDTESMYSAKSNDTMDYNSKKMKIEPNMKPSRVVHFRGIPSDAMDSEVLQLGIPFGKMANLVFAKKKNQALLEMEDINAAKDLVNYYIKDPPLIRERTVYVQYSNYDHLKTDPSQSMDGIDGLMDESKVVLRVVIENMIYPVTIDVLKLIFGKYGQVQKIIIFNKFNFFQALIQMGDAASAKSALLNLNGHNIYNGCCTLRIDYSHMTSLQVKYNNDKSWDFTVSNDTMSLLEGGDGILGPYIPSAGLGGFGSTGVKATNSGTSLLGLGGLLGGGLLPGSNNLLGLSQASGGGTHPTQAVIIVSNLNEEKVTPDYLFTLFGMYGMVTRVKIMYNKKDTALVQFQDHTLAQNAISCLDKLKWYGKVIKVSQSKHNYIQMPRDPHNPVDQCLTKDYSNSKLHRHNNPASKNYGVVNPPSGTLHVANLPDNVKEDELKEIFASSGQVNGVKLFEKDRKMALVEMASVEDAVAALVETHNYHVFGGQYLKVSFTKSVI